MGFNIYTEDDERRKIESWFLTENHDLYLKWKERLSDAWISASDAFIRTPPVLLHAVDEIARPSYGELAEGVFFQDSHQFNFESECLLVNTQFWKECGRNMSVYEMILKLGEMVESDDERIKTLTDWGLTRGLHCLGVYPAIL